MRQMSIIAMIGFFLSIFVGVIGSLGVGVFHFWSILLRGLVSAGVVFGLALVASQLIKQFLPELMLESTGDNESAEIKKKESLSGHGLFHKKDKQDADIGNNVNMMIDNPLGSLDAKASGVGFSGSSYEDKNAKATEVFRSQDPALLAQMVRKSMSNDDDD